MRSLVLTVMLAGSALAKEPPPPPPRVTLVVVGAQSARIEHAMAETRDMPVEVVVGRLPNRPASARDGVVDLAQRIATARTQYVNGDFSGCLKSLAGETVVGQLLAEGRRELGARTAFWQIACRVGAGATAEARELAHQFAVRGLDMPADVAAAAPEVESLLARALKESAAAHKAVLAVEAGASRARVSLDGRAGLCVTPCSLDVPPGDHVVAIDADGALPASRVVRVSEPRTEVKFESTPASPEIAAEQWTARYGGSALLYSEPSTRLLAQAIVARRLVLVNAEGDRDLRLRGTLATDGTVRAQVERTASPSNLDTESRRLLRDLLVTGKVFEPAQPIYKRAAFWVPLSLAVGAAVIAASIAGTAHPNVKTQVGF